MAISVVINCRNWIFYYIKIGEMSYDLHGLDNKCFKMAKNSIYYQKILKIVTLIVVAIYITIMLTFAGA